MDQVLWLLKLVEVMASKNTYIQLNSQNVKFTGRDTTAFD